MPGVRVIHERVGGSWSKACQEMDTRENMFYNTHEILSGTVQVMRGARG